MPPKTLHNYLQSLLPAHATNEELSEVISHIPVNIREQLIRAWVDQVQQFWSPGRCAYIKGRCRLSNEHWLTLNNVMFRTWKKADGEGKSGRWVTKQFDGVEVPIPWARWTIDKVRKRGREEAGVESSQDGLAVSRPLKPRLEARWRAVLGQLVTAHGPDVLDSDQVQRITINPFADKARARGARTGVTVIACRLSPPLLRSASSMHCTEFLSYNECDDSNADLHTFAKATLDELNDLFTSGSVIIDNKEWALEPTLSGDGAYHASCYCHGSFLSAYPCPFCFIKKADLCDTRVSVHKGAGMRTLESIRRLTHRACSGAAPCEGCGLWVVETDEEVESKGGIKFAVRVCRGDSSDPPPPWQSQTRTAVRGGVSARQAMTWDQWHYNVVYGQDVVWQVEPACAILCTLHWDLQLTPLLIQGLVARHLDPDWKEKREGPQTDVLCAAINHFGRDVTPLEEPRKFPELAGGRTLYGRHGRLAAGLRVDGTTARAWHAARETVLDIVFSDRDTKKERKAQHSKAIKTWDMFVKLRDLLHTPFEYGKAFVLCTEAEIHALWNNRAEVFESTAVKFLEAFRASCNGIGEGSWYLHCTLAHIPDNIRRVGLMSDYSTEALEAGHVWLNNVLQNGSNHIQGERMLQVMTARTTEEYVVSSEPDLQEACDRAEAKKPHQKATRLVAALRRAQHSVADVKAAVASCTSGSAVTETLRERKAEHATEARAAATWKRKAKAPKTTDVAGIRV